MPRSPSGAETLTKSDQTAPVRGARSAAKRGFNPIQFTDQTFAPREVQVGPWGDPPLKKKTPCLGEKKSLISRVMTNSSTPLKKICNLKQCLQETSPSPGRSAPPPKGSKKCSQAVSQKTSEHRKSAWERGHRVPRVRKKAWL